MFLGGEVVRGGAVSGGGDGSGFGGGFGGGGFGGFGCVAAIVLIIRALLIPPAPLLRQEV